MLGGGTDTIGGETAGSGGDKGGSSINIGGRELLIALPVQEKRCFKLTFRFKYGFSRSKVNTFYVWIQEKTNTNTLI